MLRCKTCNTIPKDNIMRCSRCQSVYYCDSACQLKDWPTHAPLCVAASTSTLPPAPAPVQYQYSSDKADESSSHRVWKWKSWEEWEANRCRWHGGKLKTVYINEDAKAKSPDEVDCTEEEEETISEIIDLYVSDDRLPVFRQKVKLTTLVKAMNRIWEEGDSS